MTLQEVALLTWKQQKKHYQKSIDTVLEQLSIPVPLIPSTEYDTKFDELKEYLKFNYIYDEEEKFIEIYVHQIAGQKNISLMQLSNKFMNEIGGNIRFWQNKIIDIAMYVTYHPELSIWEVNKLFQKHMGVSPELVLTQARKKSLAKNYLATLMLICKNIDKAKSSQEDLIKIDEIFKKLKKIEEKYYAFLQQTQSKKYSQNSNISKRGKNSAKSSLFLFLKPKNQQPSQFNTLINYNFKIRLSQIEQEQLLKGKQYEQFDQVFRVMRKQSFSQRLSNSRQKRQSSFVYSTKKPLNQLKQQFFAANKKQKSVSQSNATFIWSKQYFFSYWGFIINYTEPINFTIPFKKLPEVNYEIDSEQQFDELNAEDVLEEANSSYSSLDNDSFVVSDNHDSQQEDQGEKPDKHFLLTSNFINKPWVKYGVDMNEYEMLCLYSQSLPLPIQNEAIALTVIDLINKKSKNQIFEFFEKEYKDISKTKIEAFLKKNFRKVKNKERRVIFMKIQDEDTGKEKQTKSSNSDYPSEAETLAQSYQISINGANKIPQQQEVDENSCQDFHESNSNTQTRS